MTLSLYNRAVIGSCLGAALLAWMAFRMVHRGRVIRAMADKSRRKTLHQTGRFTQGGSPGEDGGDHLTLHPATDRRLGCLNEVERLQEMVSSGDGIASMVSDHCKGGNQLKRPLTSSGGSTLRGGGRFRGDSCFAPLSLCWGTLGEGDELPGEESEDGICPLGCAPAFRGTAEVQPSSAAHKGLSERITLTEVRSPKVWISLSYLDRLRESKLNQCCR